MAAADRRSIRLVLTVALAAGALGASAQTATQGGGSIVVEPLPPPIGGETLPQPRFMRAPQDGGGGEATGGTAPQEAAPAWERSRDGRFHRAPEARAAPAEEAPAPVVPIDPPDTALRAGARLRELDKMTGQTRTFDLAVGETREVDRLRIELDACRSPEGNDTHGTMAFVKVWDTKDPGADELFSGWMFAESPALSAIDHPRYDLWVISCTTSEDDGSASRQ
jgi:hypothetical protein